MNLMLLKHASPCKELCNASFHALIKFLAAARHIPPAAVQGQAGGGQVWDFFIDQHLLAQNPTGRSCVRCVVSAPLAATLLDTAVAADPSLRAWFQRSTCCLVLLWHRCTTRAMVSGLQALGFGLYCRTQLYRYNGNFHVSHNHIRPVLGGVAAMGSNHNSGGFRRTGAPTTAAVISFLVQTAPMLGKVQG